MTQRRISYSAALRVLERQQQRERTGEAPPVPSLPVLVSMSLAVRATLMTRYQLRKLAEANVVRLVKVGRSSMFYRSDLVQLMEPKEQNPEQVRQNSHESAQHPIALPGISAKPHA